MVNLQSINLSKRMPHRSLYQQLTGFTKLI